MDIIFTGDNLAITDAIHDYATKRLERLSHRGKHILRIHVIFGTEKLAHTAKATLHIPGKDVVASASDEDLYAAIDALTDKLSRQLTDVHDRTA
jgi:putative sigma-54 modulation protein